MFSGGYKQRLATWIGLKLIFFPIFAFDPPENIRKPQSSKKALGQWVIFAQSSTNDIDVFFIVNFEQFSHVLFLWFYCLLSTVSIWKLVFQLSIYKSIDDTLVFLL